MRKIEIGGLTLNIGVGEPGERLENAKAILERLTERKPVLCKTKKRTTFGVAKGRSIGVKVTIRKKDSIELLKRLLKAKENKLSKKCFSGRTFSFGINEYIDIPNMEYDPKIGILGMDVCVTLKRPGFNYRRIGKKHKITSEDAINFVKENFDIEII